MEAFEKNCRCTIFEVSCDSRAQGRMTADENISKLFFEAIVVFIELSEELEYGNLKEWILNSSDLILALKLKSYLPICSLYFRQQFNYLRDVSLIDTDCIL